MDLTHSMKQNLEDIASELLQHHDSLPLQVTQSLPSPQSVISIACDLRELLFPGFQNLRHPGSVDESHEIVDLLQSVSMRLEIEFARALQHRPELRIHDQHGNSHLPSDSCPKQLAATFLNGLPALKSVLMQDVGAAFDGDPAAKTYDEIVLCYPGLTAITIHRIAHAIHQLQIPYLPRMLSEWAHCETGIDIHPAATIGPRFFIDHGTGVVIGETCEIGAGVTLYQGVTLGAWSFPRDEDGNLIRGQKRHPTLEDNVVVYSNASILGGTTVVGAGSQIGSGVTLSRTIPSRTIVTIESPTLKFREAG